MKRLTKNNPLLHALWFKACNLYDNVSICRLKTLISVMNNELISLAVIR